MGGSQPYHNPNQVCAPKAAPGYLDVIASVRLAPGEPTVLTKTLPKGITCVPMHFSTKDGVWEGLPFVVP